MATTMRLKYWWVETIAETCIIMVALYYIFSSNLIALMVWEMLAFIYIAATIATVWSGTESVEVPAADRKIFAWWSGIFTLISSVVGVNSAVWALIAKAKQTDTAMTMGIVASLGVVLSWMLLQTGFAQIYEILDAQNDHAIFDFPGAKNDNGSVLLNYLYFSYTLGASFATSDVNITHVHGRRWVLIHSILSFFYNALVVAVAFQVLQSFIT